jgi:hypothetical protein
MPWPIRQLASGSLPEPGNKEHGEALATFAAADLYITSRFVSAVKLSVCLAIEIPAPRPRIRIDC